MHNGQVMAGHMISFMKQRFGNYPLFDFIEKTINDCSGKSDTNVCVTAVNFLKCFFAADKNFKTILMEIFSMH